MTTSSRSSQLVLNTKKLLYQLNYLINNKEITKLVLFEQGRWWPWVITLQKVQPAIAIACLVQKQHLNQHEFYCVLSYMLKLPYLYFLRCHGKRGLWLPLPNLSLIQICYNSQQCYLHFCMHIGHSDTSPGACNSALQPWTACLKQQNLHENS